MTVADRLRTAFARDDFEEMIAVLDPDVVWVGIRQPGEEEPPMCRNRGEVRDTFQWHIDQGNRALPKIVAESADRIVVEMNLQQPSDVPELYQLLTVQDDRVVEIRDFPDRTSAFVAGGLAT
jgi:ketosteroid isomerase-like protein